MTREDRLLIRGWTHAQQGLPPDPHEDPFYREGYELWLETMRQKRISKAILNLRVPPRQRH